MDTVCIYFIFFQGHVFANLPHNEKFASEASMAKDDDDADKDELLINVSNLGVKVRNMKMDFNTGGTWRRVGH